MDCPTEFFTYRAHLKRAVDGDTFDLHCDLGFRTYRKIRMRLKEVDTPEIYGVEKESEEYEEGQRIKRLVEDWIDEHQSKQDVDYVVIRTEKDDRGKYGRWLGDLWVPGHDVSLVERLKQEDSVETFD